MDAYNIIVLIIIFVGGITLGLFVWKKVGNKKIINPEIPDVALIKNVLHEKVSFFNKLDLQQQETFINRVSYFLHTTKISPEKGAVVNDEH